MKIAGLAVVALACLAAGSSSHAAMYATTAAGTPGELYIINPATGAMISDVGPLNDANGQNYPITGLAYNATTGVMYGSTGNSVAATAATLVTINLATGLVTPIGSFNAGPTNSSGTPSTMGDLGFDPATGTLYGVGTIGGPQLYTINPATGQATVVGSTGLTSTTGGGVAVNGAGGIYGTPTASRFGTYNAGTGVYTDIANPTKPAGGGYGALEFSGGTLYGLNVGSSAGGVTPTHLVTIDPATGAVTDLGASIDFLDAIAVTPEPATLSLLLGSAGLLAVRRRA